MTGSDATTHGGGRRWLLPVAIGAIVLALGGGIGLGVALTGSGGESTEMSPTPSTGSTSDATNSGGGGGSRSSDTGGGTTNSGGGSATPTSNPASAPTSPPTSAPVGPEFTYALVRDVTCVSGAPKNSSGNTPNLYVEWATARATSVDISNARNSLGSNYPPKGSSNITYHCGGYGVDRDPTSITLVAHGPQGDTSKTLFFDVTDA